MSNEYPENYECRDPIQFAEQELKLAGFADTAYGKATLEYIKQSYAMANNDINVVRNLFNNIIGLINHNPLVPITEDEFEPTEILEYMNGEYKKVIRSQHKRIPFIFKLDGKYYDERAIAFVQGENTWYGSNGENKSLREITEFPYYRREQQIYLD